MSLLPSVDTALKTDSGILKQIALRAVFAKYRQAPLLWLEERFGEDPKSFAWSLWGEPYEGHIWDGTKDPLATAWNALAQNNWVGVESATSTGKTFWLARVVFWFLDCWEGSLVVTSAPVAGQLKAQLWAEMKTAFHKFKKIRPYAEMYDSLRLLPDARGFDELADDDVNMQAWQAIGVASRASSGSQSNTTRQGFHRKDMLIIVEEATGIDFASLEAYKNTSTGGHNVILTVGNPDSQLDPLHQFCESPNVFAVQASGYDAPNVVLGKEVIGGGVTRESIEKRRLDYGENSNLFQSRVRGISPAQSTNSLIHLDWIKSALQNVEQNELEGAGAVGLDVSNSEGGDKAAVAFGIGNVLCYLKDFQCPNASHLAYNLLQDDVELEENGYQNYRIPTIYDYHVMPYYVGVDAVGVGVSTINTFDNELTEKVVPLQGGMLKQVIPTDNEGKPMYSFSALRSQMYWEFREDLRNGEVIFLDSIPKATIQELMRELVSPTFSSKAGKISVESKDEIKRRLGHSPNKADAVVYWNWVRKGYYAPTHNSEYDNVKVYVG